MLGSIKRHPFVSAVAVATIAALAWGFWPQPVTVEAAPVKRAPLTVAIEEEGRTRVVQRYVVSAPMDGVACRVDLNVGDPVSQGQVLLHITPLESQVLDPRSRARARAQVAAAESALKAAEEQARTDKEMEKLAAAELERMKRLVNKRLISLDTFDKAATEANATAASRRAAEFRVEVAKHELQAARSVLEYATGESREPVERVPIQSPINGRILKIDHECEGPVRTGDPLLEVGDPAALEVEVDVLSADAVKISPGMTVLFERWGGEQPLQGVVRNIEPVGFTKVSALGVEEQRVLVICDFTSPKQQWQRLGDGYRVEARFILWHQDGVMQIPASSLFRHQGGWAVFVIDERRAVRREVTVGQRNGLVAQVLSGLEEGEVVINHPSDAVDDGIRVTTR